ncbi:MAG: cytochrome c biogenesis protein CcsA [Gammaproteobacteria bacterium]|nr:cytochrome c biogenesis protein CcsA [Gammaproteobacteria bacterium]MCP5201195.1 cytochrome c biogenesis protein CcsA [Gammaproteobacteria bacterium]
MSIVLFGLLAIVLYVAVAIRSSTGSVAAPGGDTLSAPTTLIAAAALVAHALALYPMAFTAQGFNFGIFTAASLVAWLITVITVIASTRRPLASLAVVILPFAAVVVGLSLAFSHPHIIHEHAPGIALHIALSLVAYALFAIAAVQALYYAFAERRLKAHHPVMSFLPPLTVMEQTMFQLTGIAFVLLSVGLATGIAYIEDVRGQHLAHKIVFSGLAWLTFAVLLAGRRWRRWRGRHAVKYVIGGTCLLAVGFFGSKIALELILNRA